MTRIACLIPSALPQLRLISKNWHRVMSHLPETLNHNWLVDGKMLRNICTTFPSLSSLDLSKCVFLQDQDLECLSAQNRTLVTLSLAGCEVMTEIGLSHLARLNKLSSLDLSGATSRTLTPAKVASLQKLTALTSLQLGRVRFLAFLTVCLRGYVTVSP